MILRATVFVIAVTPANHFATGECVTIGTPPASTFVQSSGNLRVNVHRDGQPASFALVTVTKYGERTPLLRSASGENGEVVPIALATGKYEVHALAADGGSGSLLVSVSASQVEQVTSADLALRPRRFRADVVSDAAKTQRFKGVVRDPSGAQIPRTMILVVPRKTSSHSVIELTTGLDGTFAQNLPDGEYVAFFSSPGFRMKIVRLATTPQGEGNLLVALNIASDC